MSDDEGLHPNDQSEPEQPVEPVRNSVPKKVSTELVEIAHDLFDLGCTAPVDRGGEIHVYAMPKSNHDMKRPLADIRPDLATVYAGEHGQVPPSAGQLAEAMLVLEGEARVTDPTPMSNSLRDLLGLGGGAEELIEFIHDRYDLGVTDTGDPYGVPKGGPNIVRLLHGGRPSFRSEVALAYWQKEQMVPKSTDLSSALMIIEGECHQCPPVTPALRAGRNQADGRLILDLGNEVGEAVTIDFQGWHVGPSPVLLRRTEATMPLPTPVAGSNLNQLRSFLTIGDKDWPLGSRSIRIIGFSSRWVW